MIASAEIRRNATLREIQRRRSGLAARLREATRDADHVQNVQEAEFQVIDAPAASTAPAA
jgi:hypothetical protein